MKRSKFEKLTDMYNFLDDLREFHDEESEESITIKGALKNINTARLEEVNKTIKKYYGDRHEPLTTFILQPNNET